MALCDAKNVQGTQDTSPFEFYSQWTVTAGNSYQSHQANTINSRELEMQNTLKSILEALDEEEPKIKKNKTANSRRAQLLAKARACLPVQEPPIAHNSAPVEGEKTIYLKRMQLMNNNEEMGKHLLSKALQ